MNIETTLADNWQEKVIEFAAKMGFELLPFEIDKLAQETEEEGFIETFQDVTGLWLENDKYLELKSHLFPSKYPMPVFKRKTKTSEPIEIDLPPLATSVPRVDVTQPPDISMFNEEQKEAFDLVMDVLTAPSKGDEDYNGEYQHALVTGAAGTGKTFLIQKLIHTILATDPTIRIAMAAPTHKAVQVSRKMSPFINNQKEYGWDVKDKQASEKSMVNYITVHKLLDKVPKQDETTGEEIFVRNPKVEIGDEAIRKFHIIFVDETGMCDGGKEGMLTELMSFGDAVTFVFIGDSAQIYPINTPTILSPVFIEKYRERKSIAFAELKTVMRQALDNPVLAQATEFRETGEYTRKNATSPTGKTIFTRDGEHVDELVWEIFGSEHFQHNSDYAKVLAYNRKVADEWNSRVRNILHRKNNDTQDLPPKLVAGDQLVLSGPYVDQEETGQPVIFNNFQELTVIDVKLVEEYLPRPTGAGLKVTNYLLTVEYEDVNSGEVEQRDRVFALHEGSEAIYQELVKAWADHARMLIRTTVDKKAIANAWRNFWALKARYLRFGYNFALTVHRSQGSSFQFTLLAETNIRSMKNKGAEQAAAFNQVMYVALSRARYCNILIGKGEK